MRVILLGTGFAVPSSSRVQSGILVETRDNLILFDCGAGVVHRLAQSGYDSMDITHVFFTHHHLDHDSDFMALLKANWLKDRKNLTVFGPMGTERWLSSLFEAYPYLKDRTDIGVMELENMAMVKIGGDVVEARSNKHALEGLAYRLTSSDKSMVYSGDTAPCEGVRGLCEGGVELLIHECSFSDAGGERYADHTTPEGLGRLLTGLPVKKVVLTHFSHMAEERLGEMKASLERYFKGEIMLGEDLMELELV
jgi:ribonuclease BN (tRNA processing enzyme)